MPCTVKAARLMKMIAQMRALPRLFDLAALFMPEMEVPSPNLGNHIFLNEEGTMHLQFKQAIQKGPKTKSFWIIPLKSLTSHIPETHSCPHRRGRGANMSWLRLSIGPPLYITHHVCRLFFDRHKSCTFNKHYSGKFLQLLSL